MNRSVENGIICRRVLVNAEITVSHKLERIKVFCIPDTFFNKAVFKNNKGFGVDCVNKFIIGNTCGVLNIEKSVIKSDFGFKGFGTCPMDCTLDFSAVGGITALCFGVVGAMKNGYIAVSVGLGGFLFRRGVLQ